ncbi:RagB/SusD family nutrient uptake outer membrane protein [Aquimarina agarivorans]|uniref:RagB/SusD family nutrient uptake outer membrane protein n=1 Tax=Aquimarina agarivorans TaxID=980584 RepID=UPI000248FB42|nr:RagB/SusD family nutrient uptake outer membrane protein [Aquimarina agarivorans]
MKKINNKVLLCLGSLILGFSTNSCEDITSENNTTTASFATFEELVQGRLPSIYASLRSNALYRQGGLLGTWSDVGVDTHTGTLFPEEYLPLYLYNYAPGTLLIGQTWTEFYTAIKQINTFLGQISTFSVSEDEKNPVIAEARFLRALLYFDMVKIWGDIPLVISEDITLAQIREDSSLTNTTAEEVYVQIIKDLEFAKENGNTRVGSTADIASKEAAQVLLGKVFLQMTTTKEYGGVEGGTNENGDPMSRQDRFVQANAELKEVMESQAFQLERNYADVFINENNNEVIFSVGYDGPNSDVGGDFGDFLGQGNLRDGGSFGAYRAGADFALSYLNGDVLITDQAGSDVPETNMLPKLNREFFDFPNSNFRPEVLLLGVDNFVSDTRFSHNIWRIAPTNVGRRLRGEGSFTLQDAFNQENLGWGNWSPLKYIKPLPNSSAPGDGAIDFPFLRYADVLLMRAEALIALNDLGQARELINTVIMRSLKDKVLKTIPEGVVYITPVDNEPGTPQADLNTAIEENLEDVDPTAFLVPEGLDAEELIDRLVIENAKELAFEGKRKDDLIRMGRLDRIVNSFHVDSHPDRTAQNFLGVKAGFDLELHTHWPIPQDQLILNPNLKQNCLYGTNGIDGCF